MRLLVVLIFSMVCFLANGQDNKSQNGYTKIYYPNGKIASEGFMVNGKPDKYWKTYYVNGVTKSEGNRKNHLLDSIWIFYNELGDTLEKINFVLGKKNGYSYKYTSIEQKNSNRKNVLVSKELFVNDKKEGLSYYYFPEGKVHEVINYKNNKRHGTGKEFNKDSVVITLYEFFNDYMTDKQNINRTLNGAKVGVWKEFYSDGKVKAEREYKADQLTGYSKEFDKTGKLTINLLYNDGKLIDKPASDSLDIDEKIEYGTDGKISKRGYYRKGIPVGIHREYDTDGKVKNALVYGEDGKLVSKGIINDDGTREGDWVYFFDDGSKKSEGVYRNNRQNGNWKFFYKNGLSEQQGNFRNGVLTGEWKWFWGNNKPLRIENYLNGKRDGDYIELSLVGDTIEVGKYLEGEKDGLWKTTTGDMVEIGTYVNGLKEGVWKEFYKNGVLAYEGSYLQGNADGKHIYYYPNGRVREEQFYVSGIKEKVWKKYSEDGILLLAITYENDTETRVNGVKIEEIKRN